MFSSGCHTNGIASLDEKTHLIYFETLCAIKSCSNKRNLRSSFLCHQSLTHLKMDYEEKQHNTGEIILNYYENETSAPPFLYLHGAGNIWQTIIPLLPNLSKDWSMYAYDLRGRGKSGWNGGLDRLNDHLKDAISFIGQKIKDPVVVFGWSMGGIIGSMLAVELPENVKALILGDSPIFLYEDKSKWAAMIEPMQLFFVKSNECRAKVDSLEEYIEESANLMVDWPTLEDPISLEALIRGDIKDEEIFHLFAECWYRVHADVVDGWFNPEALDILTEGYKVAEIFPKIKCPTLIIQADPSSGGMVKDEDVERMMELIPNATHVKLEKIGHSLHLANRETLYRVINEFIKKLD